MADPVLRRTGRAISVDSNMVIACGVRMNNWNLRTRTLATLRYADRMSQPVNSDRAINEFEERADVPTADFAELDS